MSCFMAFLMMVGAALLGLFTRGRERRRTPSG